MVAIKGSFSVEKHISLDLSKELVNAIRDISDFKSYFGSCATMHCGYNSLGHVFD